MGPFTSEAIVFISRFEVRLGHLTALRLMWDSVGASLERAKPRTLAYLGYTSDGGAELTIVHVFPDGDAMAAHVAGSDDRSRAAYEHVRPAGWEIYGSAPEDVVAQLGEAALAGGVDLTIHRGAIGGFLRLSAP